MSGATAKVVLVVGMLSLGLVQSAIAQPVINPTRMEFIPSANHNDTIEGVPLITRYDLRVFAVAAPEVTIVSISIGKPTPVNNLVSMPLPPLAAVPLSTNAYFGRVVAVGPTGEGASLPSNPFYVVGPLAAPENVILSRGDNNAVTPVRRPAGEQ